MKSIEGWRGGGENGDSSTNGPLTDLSSCHVWHDGEVVG